MFPLRCSVRNCENILEQHDRHLTCAHGHHFDQAKQGYWPLLQPQDRKSRNCGDSDESVLARQRWLGHGHMQGLVEELSELCSTTEATTSPPWTLDLGCGEGTFARELFASDSHSYCGIDLSKRALRLASRSWPAATWVLANADRILPVANDSVHRVVSLFGRRPWGEIARILQPGGVCLIAVPGEDDLIELRAHVQQAGIRRNRWQIIVDEATHMGFECIQHRYWSYSTVLDAEAIVDAMAMSYRAFRKSERERLEHIPQTRVTLSADLLLLRRSPENHV